MSRDIVLERFYPFTVNEVWEAISTSEGLAAWLMPNNFRLEKNYSFQFKTKPQLGFDGIVNCRVVDFSEPTMLQFTWQGGPLKKPTLITFKLSEVTGGTILTFRQSGFEGFVGNWIIRLILANGWKALLTEKIKKYLDHE